MRRTERLFAMTDYLRRRRTAVTVGELARHFGITERTVHRDLASLRAQSVAVEGEPGRGGGLRLADGHSMPPLGLTVDEGLSLWLSLRLGALAGLVPAGETLATAMEKVLGAMTAERRRALDAVVRRVVVGIPPGPRLVEASGPTDAGIFRTIEHAFTRSQAVRIRYVDRDARETERTIEPHGLLVQAPLWYVIAIDPAKAAPRTFRVDRIRAASAEAAHAFAPRDPRALFRDLETLRLAPGAPPAKRRTGHQP